MFYEEIKALEQSNLADKEKIFYIYISFYKEIIAALSVNHVSFIEIYKKYLKDKFISRVKSQNDSKISFRGFLVTLIVDIDSDLDENNIKIRNITNAKKTANRYITTLLSDCFLDSIEYKQIDSIVNELNKFDMNFSTKAYIIVYLKEYFKHFSEVYTTIYKSLPNYDSNINKFIHKVIQSLPEIIKVSNNHKEFQYNLQRKTYLLIEDEFKHVNSMFGNYAFYSFRDRMGFMLGNYSEFYRPVIFEFLSGYIKEETREEKFLQRYDRQRKIKKIRNRLKAEGLSIKI